MTAAEESGDADLITTIQTKIDKITGTTTTSSSSKDTKEVVVEEEEEETVAVEESEEITKLLAEQALFVKLGDDKMAAKVEKLIAKARAEAEEAAAKATTTATTSTTSATTTSTSTSSAAVEKLEAEMATFVSLGDEKVTTLPPVTNISPLSCVVYLITVCHVIVNHALSLLSTLILTC